MSDEPILPGREEPVFPITNRSTPILDRIRDRRSKTLGLRIGNRVAELAISDDQEEKNEISEQFRRDFRTGLSNSLGVPRESIRDGIVEDFSVLFGGLNEGDLLVQGEALGGQQEQEPDIQDEPEESSEEDVEEEDTDDSTPTF